MKLSARSRYGTRMMLDMAQHYGEGPVAIGNIAKRQNISVKYLEQLITPLREANYVKSFRGTRGGYMLARAPDKISIGEIVKVLEGEISLSRCVENPDICDRSDTCVTRLIWEVASRAMYKELNSISLSELIDRGITK